MEKNSKFKVVGDLIYSVGAIALMNVVLQFFVYPRLNSNLGAGGFGDVLYLMGIIGIVSASFGLAANNTILVIRNKYEVTNGDFAVTMLIFSLIGVVISFFCVRAYLSGIGQYLAFFALTVITSYRYFSDVEFRLKINSKKYFRYYLILTIGYCIGYLGYRLIIGSWYLVFLVGEAAAVLYVVLRGNLLTKQLSMSSYKFKAFKSSATLALSYLLFNAILFIDRILLLYIVDNEAVSHYYVASLLGKTLAILTGPLNSIIISYITKDNKSISKKQFLKIILAVTAISAVFFAACCIATPIFIKIFYPDLYDATRSITAIASLAQILCFSSTIFLTVVLTFTSEKYQFAVQLLFAAVFIACAIPMTMADGVFGFAVAAVIANFFRFVLVCIIGYIKAPKNCIENQNLIIS